MTMLSVNYVRVPYHHQATPTHVVDADLGLGRGLHESAVAELPRQVQALVFPDHAFLLEVALVADQHHGHVVSVL